MPTIKTLFAEASNCAYPECTEPLIFRDRGRSTVIAEIAHIRSEQPDGPRYDPDFTGDVDGPDNLLLLCGKHHKPVDRHEVTYTTTELLQWKALQRATAGAGIPIDEKEARSYARLSAEENAGLLTIVRLKQRLIRACTEAQRQIDAVLTQYEVERVSAARALGPMYEIDDDGNSTPVNMDTYSLPRGEQQRWNERLQAIRTKSYPSIAKSYDALDEELAILSMYGGTLAGASEQVGAAAAALVQNNLSDRASLDQKLGILNAKVTTLWQAAHGSDGSQ